MEDCPKVKKKMSLLKQEAREGKSSRVVVEESQAEGLIHKDAKVRDSKAHLGTGCLGPHC